MKLFDGNIILSFEGRFDDSKLEKLMWATLRWEPNHLSPLHSVFKCPNHSLVNGIRFAGSRWSLLWLAWQRYAVGQHIVTSLISQTKSEGTKHSVIVCFFHHIVSFPFSTIHPRNWNGIRILIRLVQLLLMDNQTATTAVYVLPFRQSVGFGCSIYGLVVYASTEVR